jgi:cell division protein FtsQ
MRPAAGEPHDRQRPPLWPHALARTFAVGFLAFSIGYGLMAGGRLNTEAGPVRDLSERLAAGLGHAALQVRITGLERHPPEKVLDAIGVRLGGSLVGFDAVYARKALEGLGWIETAKVHRIYPNQLAIVITERQPFAVWQRDGIYVVIDRSGAVMGEAGRDHAGLLLVTGEGADRGVSDLVNRLEAHPDLGSLVRAAARVGDRRWTLHLSNGQRIALPETGMDAALTLVEDLNRRHGLFGKAVAEVDLRLKDRVTFVPQVKDAGDDLPGETAQVSER